MLKENSESYDAGEAYDFEVSLGGLNVSEGDLLDVDSSVSTLNFTITNKGNRAIFFRGVPQVILSKEKMADGDRGYLETGISSFGNFEVSSFNQPKELVLQKNEITSFSVAVKTALVSNEITAVNIPRNSLLNDAFTFYLRKK